MLSINLAHHCLFCMYVKLLLLIQAPKGLEWTRMEESSANVHEEQNTKNMVPYTHLALHCDDEDLPSSYPQSSWCCDGDHPSSKLLSNRRNKNTYSPRWRSGGSSKIYLNNLAAYKPPDLHATFPRGVGRSTASFTTIAWWQPGTSRPSWPSWICSVIDEIVWIQ